MSAPDVSMYFDFFRDYYGTFYILIALGIMAVMLGALYAVFHLSHNSRIRTLSLVAMMATSASLWTFVLFSFAFCTLLILEYLKAPVEAINLAAQFSLVFCLIVVPMSVLFLRNRAAKILFLALLPSFDFLSHSAPAKQGNSSSIGARVSTAFAGASVKASSNPLRSKIELGVVSGHILPSSAAVDWRGRKIVAVSREVVDLLDDQELESVLAHELGHIENRDSLFKTLATALKMAFFFDPIAHLLEAAIYREREFDADEYSARATRNPSSLASALIKIYENMARSPLSKQLTFREGSAFQGGGPVSLLSVSIGTRRFLAKEPPLSLRIRRLLEIEKTLS
ncbi:MAG TPA: M48 family metalloprotease [Nitrososphaerales archaeon]|nr:M48 family metalloprotease [Nitrososphaerales archaeon]